MTSGGFFYHYLAWKYRRRLWQPFLNEVGTWLNQWEQKSLDLILVGPSAGYSLPPEFVYRYDRVIVIEKDSLGAYLFKKKFGQVKSNIFKDDLFRRLPLVLKDYPDADLVFCNVLGQVFIDWRRQGWNEKEFTKWKAQLRELIKDRYWCSYHDLYSIMAKIDFIKVKERFSNTVTVEELIKVFATKFKLRSIEVIDHLTHDFFMTGKRDVQHWQLAPRSHFFIEFIRSDDAYPNLATKPSYLEKLMAPEL
ncbi:MAG: hypothetical protein SGJ18_09975 [Pseudomonadota bacterium]|nr:hypothetical protein [Pseudomonadota bacterium]